MLDEHSTNWVMSTIELDSVKSVAMPISYLQGLNYSDVCGMAATLSFPFVGRGIKRRPIADFLLRLRMVNLKP